MPMSSEIMRQQYLKKAARRDIYRRDARSARPREIADSVAYTLRALQARVPTKNVLPTWFLEVDAGEGVKEESRDLHVDDKAHDIVRYLYEWAGGECRIYVQFLEG